MSNLRKMLIFTVIGSLCLSAIVAIAIFLFGDLGDVTGKVLATTSAIGLYAVTSLLCSLLLGKHNRFEPLAWSGVVASFLGLVYSVSIIWEIVGLNFFDSASKLFISLHIVLVALVHVNLLFLIQPLEKFTKSLLFSTTGFIVITVLMLLMWLYELSIATHELYWRLTGVVIVLNVLGTVVTPIMHVVTRKRQ